MLPELFSLGSPEITRTFQAINIECTSVILYSNFIYLFNFILFYYTNFSCSVEELAQLLTAAGGAGLCQCSAFLLPMALFAGCLGLVPCSCKARATFSLSHCKSGLNRGRHTSLGISTGCHVCHWCAVTSEELPLIPASWRVIPANVAITVGANICCKTFENPCPKEGSVCQTTLDLTALETSLWLCRLPSFLNNLLKVLS